MSINTLSLHLSHGLTLKLQLYCFLNWLLADFNPPNQPEIPSQKQIFVAPKETLMILIIQENIKLDNGGYNK